MKEAFIVVAKRTAIGTLMGGLSTVPAPELSARLIESIISETQIPAGAVDEVILGQVLTGGAGQNPARQAVIAANMPVEVPAFTLNKVCGSGLKAITLAAQSIKCGDADIVLAGGQENMSLAMHGAYIRGGVKFGDLKLTDLMQHDGLTDAFSCQAMGITAENIAKQFGISRKDEDEFALESQQRAAKAQKEGKFKDEIQPISVTKRKETVEFSEDEGVRGDSSIDKLAKLKPAFVKDQGTVTAGNSSTINDGAAVLLVASENALKQHNLTPLAQIISYGQAGVAPEIMGTGPVPASKLALKRAGWAIGDLDLIEANQAFAAQALYVNREMGWDPSKVSVNGGAIALGHPIGASGARITTTLLHELKRANKKKGLATLCIGGGQGLAICLEMV